MNFEHNGIKVFYPLSVCFLLAAMRIKWITVYNQNNILLLYESLYFSDIINPSKMVYVQAQE